MENIKSHVAWAHHTDERVHICSVIVKESATLMHKGSNLFDVLLKESESVRVGHHDTSDAVVEKRFEILNINQTTRL